VFAFTRDVGLPLKLCYTHGRAAAFFRLGNLRLRFMMMRSYFIERCSTFLLQRDRSTRALPYAGTESVAVSLVDQPGLTTYNLDRPFRASLRAQAAAVAFLLIDTDYLPDCFHLFSPRHSRADAHHSAQDGILSLYTIEPHLWHLTLFSLENNSISASQAGHL
jgi:hypothetical protein